MQTLGTTDVPSKTNTRAAPGVFVFGGDCQYGPNQRFMVLAETLWRLAIFDIGMVPMSQSTNKDNRTLARLSCRFLMPERLQLTQYHRCDPILVTPYFCMAEKQVGQRFF